MSTTPNPALQAAAPVINAIIDQVTTLVTTVLTGDPMLVPARLDGAIDIFIGNVKLQLPVLANVEEGALLTTITGGLTSLKAKVQAALAPPAA